jgi:hypothetical protein
MQSHFSYKVNSYFTLKKIFVLIFLGLISSIVLSSYYIIKYDKYRDDGHSHVMLKDETLLHWHKGAKIVEDVKNGKNFFSSGDAIFSKPLPQRLVAIYSLLSGHEIIEEWEPNLKIKLGGKLPFLIIQSLVFYLALVYLLIKISKIFPIENCFYIVFFLAFEHTIFQYHSSFWTESFYFTLQILILGLLLNNSHKIFDNLFVGILVGILFLQRSVAIFYIIPIIIYFIFSYRSKSVKPIIASVVGYTLILFLVGIYNYKKIDVFYFYPVGGKQDIYISFSIPLLSKKEKVSETEIHKKEVQKAYKWSKDNNIKLEDGFDLNKTFTIFHFKSFIKNEKDKIKLYDYMNKRQYKILFENPLATTKLAIIGVIHFAVLNPIHNYYYNEHRGQNKKPVFIKSKTHKNWIPYRIIYTLLIYFVCFFGLIYFFKQKNYQLLLLLVLSTFYYIILFGWAGRTRYFVPILIYLSFFFGNGLVLLKNLLKKNERTITNEEFLKKKNNEHKKI